MLNQDQHRTMKKIKSNSYLYLVIFMGILSGFCPFITDFYLAAFPALGDYFHAPPALVQSSLASSVIGLAIGQLFIGPLSDKYGRKIPLLLSLLLFLVATVGCLWAPSIQLFIFARFLQGLVGAGGLVISRSVAADLFEGRSLTRFISMLVAIMSVAPVLAPVFGGILLTLSDWKGLFWALVALGVFMLLLLPGFVESLPSEKRATGSIFASFSAFGSLLRNAEFVMFGICQSATMGVFFAYLSASPFIFQKIYGLSPLCYSLLFGFNAVALILGGRAALFVTEKKALFISTLTMALLTIILAVSIPFHAPFFVIEAASFLLMGCHGCILTVSTSLALHPIEENKGSASAILGFFFFFVGGIITPLVGIGNIIYSSGICLFFCGMICFASAFFGIRISPRPATPHAA